MFKGKDDKMILKASKFFNYILFSDSRLLLGRIWLKLFFIDFPHWTPISSYPFLQTSEFYLCVIIECRYITFGNIAL